MGALVEIDNLGKRFGKVWAVQNLSLSIEEGTVLGFIGPNGAGKTTTLKMLATILRPTMGEARIDGHTLSRDRNAIRRAIGYMPDVCGLYEEMVVEEYLRFFAAIYHIRGAEARKAVSGALSVTGLEDKAGALCGDLSRGMSQRLHLARVLLHDPKLLLLDEPASGLDPRARIEFRDLVLTLRGMGKTLIISSHILSELGEMCDSIAIVEKSELVYSGPVDAVSEKIQAEGRVFRLRCRQELADGRSHGDLVETVRGMEYVDAVRDGEREGELMVRFRAGFAEQHALNRELIERGYKVEHFGEERIRLEDAFMHLTKGVTQ